MTVRFLTLWLFWLGGALYDIACSWVGFLPSHTPKERFYEDMAVASFIVGVWILERWIKPWADALPPPPRGGAT